MGEIVSILLGTLLVNNFVLAQFLGLCPFMGITRGYDTAAATGIATSIVLCVSCVLSQLAHHYVLAPLDATYLHIIVLMLVIVGCVQAMHHYTRANSPVLHQLLGPFLPLITSNCAILGVAVLVSQAQFNLLQTIAVSIAAAAGFTLMMVSFGALREQLDHSAIPLPLRGIPIVLISAGIMSLVFMGFIGVGQ